MNSHLRMGESAVVVRPAGLPFLGLSMLSYRPFRRWSALWLTTNGSTRPPAAFSRNDGRISGARRGKQNKLAQRRQRRRRDKMNAKGRKPEQVASEASKGAMWA